MRTQQYKAKKHHHFNSSDILERRQIKMSANDINIPFGIHYIDEVFLGCFPN